MISKNGKLLTESECCRCRMQIISAEIDCEYAAEEKTRQTRASPCGTRTRFDQLLSWSPGTFGRTTSTEHGA